MWASGGRSKRSITASTAVKVFHRPSPTFTVPCNIATPLIMVGPGTGVAPFVGFLQHRAKQREMLQADKSAVCTGTWRNGIVVRVCPLQTVCVATRLTM